ncbi:hypothetical protein [Arenibaculum pallidiluteum]|uniref:hypothetical protein n=1 Tax=Arenibaculum pallidiluteum TaxID=2812559 RepID=UPI001A96BDC5|nr:hypothetical protein [Arenibaculum pallidiluteum]
MTIARPAESAYDEASPEIRALIDQVVSELQGLPDWTQRPAVLVEMVDALDLAMNDAESEEEQAEAGEGGEEAAGGEEDEMEEADGFAEIVTFYVGAALERLEEQEITGPEQVAFYLLSCHPEHLEAAQAWLEQPGNEERFLKFVEANPDYDAILELVEDYYEAISGEDED